MTALQIIGMVMLTVPFVGFFAVTVADFGFWSAMGMWTFALFTTGAIVLGACLATGVIA